MIEYMQMIPRYLSARKIHGCGPNLLPQWKRACAKRARKWERYVLRHPVLREYQKMPMRLDFERDHLSDRLTFTATIRLIPIVRETT